MRHAFHCFMLIIALLAVAGRPAAADAVSPADREVERRLRHVRLGLDEMRLWSNGAVSTKSLSSHSPLLVVHLFSLDCPPCLREIKHLQRLFQQNTPETEFAMVLETLDANRIRQFKIDYKEQFPDVDLYISTNRRIRDASQLGVENVPITLLLDRDRVIRHAFVGILTHRQEEFLAAIVNVRDALGAQQRSTMPSATTGSRLQPEDLLHRTVTMPPASNVRLEVAYLYGAGCAECGADLEGRLRRLIQSWGADKDVRFSLLDCGPRETERPAGFAPALFRACENPELANLFQRELRPITLILDNRHVVRDAFVGSTGSGLGAALRRLQATPRP